MAHVTRPAVNSARASGFFNIDSLVQNQNHHIPIETMQMSSLPVPLTFRENQGGTNFMRQV